MANQTYRYQLRFQDEHGHTHTRNVIATNFKEAWMNVFVEALIENITPVAVDLETKEPIGFENDKR